MAKVEDYRFSLQECEVCGARFPVMYQFKEQSIAPFGFNCEHFSNGSSFIPADDEPTFIEWYQHQEYIRTSLKQDI